MPVNSHLTWVEIKNFAPGVWTNNDWLMPANAWQVMEDAYPQEGGGIRAFHKATALSVSGITDITKERVIGLHARGDIPDRSTGSSSTQDRYLCTYFFDSGASAGSKAGPRFYRMDGSNGESTWTEVKQSGAVRWAHPSNDSNAPQKTSFVFMHQLAGSPDDDWVIAVVRYSGTDKGIWRFNYNDATGTQIGVEITMAGSFAASGPITVHQSRLMVGGGGGEEKGYLYYSNPGAADASAASGYLDVDPSQDLPLLQAIVPSPPSDLFVLREGAAPVLIQGEITDQTSQVMGEGISVTNGVQDLAKTPEGYLFISPGSYIYSTDGVTYTALSQQLAAFNQVDDAISPGDINVIGEFLFAPSGYVYHLPTKSWFTQTQMAGYFHNVERSGHEIWGPVGTGVDFTLAKLVPFPVATASRVSSYHLKSAPMETADGRRIGIREVQMYVKNYEANSTITVTINGDANTVTMASTGKQQVSFLFQERGEVLDVDIVSAAADSSHEAPSIERVRIGFEPGTNLAPSE